MSAKQVLDGPALLQKIRRIAFQIFENNFEEQEIVIAGIHGQGFALADMLSKHLAEISTIHAVPVEIKLNKEIPYESPVQFSADIKTFENKVIVTDDVKRGVYLK